MFISCEPLDSIPEIPRRAHAYIRDLYRTPLLASEDETQLFRQLARLQSKLTRLTSKRNANRERDQLKQQFLQVRNQIVQANLRLVVSIARKLSSQETVRRFDFISEGNEVLIRAVELFDVERGVRFSTYATTAISRHFWRLLQTEKRQNERFQSGFGALVADESASPDTPSVEDQATEDSEILIARLLALLNTREKCIIKGRFGFKDSKRRITYRELGEQLHLSKERVRQIEHSALNKLREYCQQHHLASLGEACL